MIPPQLSTVGPYGYGRRRHGVRILGRALSAAVRGPAVGAPFRSWAWQAVAWAAGASVVVSAVIFVVAATFGHRLSPVQLWLAAMAVFLVPWTLTTLREPPESPEPFDPNRAFSPDDPFAQVARWRRRLVTTIGDVDWFTRVVRDRMVDLVAERLRQRRGITLAREPDLARAVLGEELYTFLARPLPRTPTVTELERMLTRVEEIGHDR